MNHILKIKKYFIVSIMFILFIIGLISIYFTNHRNVSAASAVNTKEEKKKEESTKEKEPQQFYVDIKGEVNSPGVYLVSEENIINDVINLANGLTNNANTKCINLSMKVSSGMVIYVYNNTETKQMMNNKTETSVVCSSVKNDAYINLNNANKSSSGTEGTNTSSSNTNTENKIVNLNTASLDILTTLPGIGESKAKDIIKYREENGGFKSLEEIKNVSGIGDSTYEKLKNLITI